MRFQRVSFRREGDGTANLQPISDYFSRLSVWRFVWCQIARHQSAQINVQAKPVKTETIRFSSLGIELGFRVRLVIWVGFRDRLGLGTKD